MRERTRRTLRTPIVSVLRRLLRGVQQPAYAACAPAAGGAQCNERPPAGLRGHGRRHRPTQRRTSTCRLHAAPPDPWMAPLRWFNVFFLYFTADPFVRPSENQEGIASRPPFPSLTSIVSRTAEFCGVSPNSILISHRRCAEIAIATARVLGRRRRVVEQGHWAGRCTFSLA